MRGYVNPVFRPDFITDYQAPQNRLAPWWMPLLTAEKMTDLPANTARVPLDMTSDVNPYADPAPVDVGAEGTSPIYPSNPTQLVERLINYDTHGQSFDYAEAIRRAMENRRRLGRGQ